MSLLDAALTYAALGWPVFPCGVRTKLPAIKRWPERATTDPERVRQCWGHAAYNIGGAAGHAHVVIDVDGQAGLDTLADLEDLNRRLPPAPTSITGSGGQHLFFAANERVRNSVRHLGPGLDTRGQGGFVVLPPSVHPNGCRYRWLEGREPWAVPLREAPAWLLDRLDRPRPPRERPQPRIGTSDAYVRAGVGRELEAVAAAGEGQRNAALFKAAARLGRFATTGDADLRDLGAVLEDAALAAGLPRRETENTIRSGFASALRSVA